MASRYLASAADLAACRVVPVVTSVAVLAVCRVESVVVAGVASVGDMDVSLGSSGGVFVRLVSRHCSLKLHTQKLY